MYRSSIEHQEVDEPSAHVCSRGANANTQMCMQHISSAHMDVAHRCGCNNTEGEAAHPDAAGQQEILRK